MAGKPKFRPIITRVKLNPEQAVLQCACYNTGHILGPLTYPVYWEKGTGSPVCSGKGILTLDPTQGT